MPSLSFHAFINDKPLFYSKINTNRIKIAYKKLSEKIYLNLGKVIHLVGTNGKGSTGNFVAKYLESNGFKVGHYTSPHIFEFNERIIINSKKITNDELDSIHKKLFEILEKDLSVSLSYFEYTTLVMILFFHEKKLDFAVIEAGMGGEFDATNVITKTLSLITPISLDHESFLGDTIIDIARTKLNSINTVGILGVQKDEVLEVAKDILKTKNIKILQYKDILTIEEIEKIQNLKIANFQKQNILLAISALKYLNFTSIDYQKLSKNILKYRLFPFKKNIILDVGHNEASAEVIVQEFKDKKIILIYNTNKDKNYIKILKILKPIIKQIQIIPIKNNERIEDKIILENNIKNLQICLDYYEGCLNKKETYLVYGSFMVVEEFYKTN